MRSFNVSIIALVLAPLKTSRAKGNSQIMK
jgi:hypothetical protein